MKIIEFRNISKSFGGFMANDGISFAINSNTVHCIVGENGAGKSTLMNILFGLHLPDSGDIFLNGAKAAIRSTHDAIALGIGMVHQHFMLIDDFTVLENVILGQEPVNGFSIDESYASGKIREISGQFDLGLQPGEKVSGLGISLRQKVEILKLLYRDSGIIIFDEPTAVLSPSEVESFYEMTRMFRNAGKTVVVITHKLNEVREIADNVTVLRKGRVVHEVANAGGNLDLAELSRAIIGKNELPEVHSKAEIRTGEVCLKLSDVSTAGGALNGLSIEVMRGEIHGVAGVEGNGQSELADIAAGIENEFSGSRIPAVPSTSIVPDDRQKKGMIREFTIGEHFLLKRKGFGFARKSEHTAVSQDVIEKYDVRAPGPGTIAGSLSGGNQQKAIIAREIAEGNELLVFSHPTRGVDISAESFIHSRVVDERNTGKAVLLISSDLDELFSLSDRLSVIYKGRIVKTFDLNDKQRENAAGILKEIGRLMTGVED